MTASESRIQTTALAPLMSSNRMDWCTPPEVLDPLRAALGPIGLDPCWNPNAITEARVRYHFAMGDDGLLATWKGHGLVFVNPPYGRALGDWTWKCEFEAARGAEIVLLVPARTDTRWFQPLWRADALCFWRGRIRFLGARTGATFPSVLAYWGPREEIFAEAFMTKGHIVRRRK